MGVLSMLPSNSGVISGEKVFRNDVFKPISLDLLKQKPDVQIEETDIESVVNDNIRILDLIRLPERFDRKAIVTFLEDLIRKDFENDPLHKQAVELDKYAKDFHRYMQRYFDKIFDYHNKLKEDLLGYVFGASNFYLKSDFPPSFARTLTFSLLTECRFIDLYNRKIRRERLALITNYNNRTKFKRVCDIHNSWVDPLSSAIERITEMRVGLIWYVDFTHSKTLEEIFKPKKLKKSLLDEEYFFGMLVNIQRETYQFRRALVNLSKETFSTFPSREDPTVNMLCSVMETMSS